MKIEQARRILATVTYKPNTLFSIEEDIGGYLLMLHVRDLPDANGGSAPVYIRSSAYFSEQEMRAMRRDYFLWNVERLCTNFEMHEKDEWFRIRGKRLNDPHSKP